MARFKPRLPFGPLFDALPTRLEVRPCGRMDQECEIGTPRQVADALGIAPRTAYRWRSEGIPVDDADRLAIALGMHPIEIWGDDWLLPVSVQPLVHHEVMECA